MTMKLYIVVLLSALTLASLVVAYIVPWFQLEVAAAGLASVVALWGALFAAEDLLDRLRAHVRAGLRQAEVVDEWLEDEADDDVRLRVAVLVTDEGPPRVVEASGPDVERAAAYWGRVEDGLCLEIPWEQGLHVWEGRAEPVSSPESWQAELVLEGSWSRASPEEAQRHASGEKVWE